MIKNNKFIPREKTTRSCIRSPVHSLLCSSELFTATQDDIADDECVSNLTLSECYKAESFLLRSALSDLYNSYYLGEHFRYLAPTAKCYYDLFKLPSVKFTTFKAYLKPGESFPFAQEWTARNLNGWLNSSLAPGSDMDGKLDFSHLCQGEYLPGGFMHMSAGVSNLFRIVDARLNIVRNPAYEGAGENPNKAFDFLINKEFKGQTSGFSKKYPHFKLVFKSSPQKLISNICLCSSNTIYKLRVAKIEGWYWNIVADFGYAQFINKKSVL